VSVRHIDAYFGKLPWSDDASSKIEGCGGRRCELDSDGDAILNRVKAPLILSIRHFQRVF
jgi:hypothetical protein